MLIIIKHILRNIRENKFRSILIIVSLAVTTMVLYVNMGACQSMTESYEAIMTDAYKRYDVAVERSSDNPGRFLEGEVDLDGIDAGDIISVTQCFGTYLYSGGDDGSIYVDVQFAGTQIGRKLDDGLITVSRCSEFFDPEADDQVVISELTAEKYGIAPDDEVEFVTEAGIRRFTVGLIAENSGQFLNEGSAIKAIITEKAARDICGSGISRYLIDLGAEPDIISQSKAFERRNEDFEMVALVDSSGIDAIGMQQIITVILGISIVMNFFVISSFTKLILATRIPVIGTFRSIGADRKKVNFILLFENVVYGIIGGGLGIALALFTNRYFISAMTGGALEKADAAISIPNIVFSLLFSVVLQLLIVLATVLKTGRMDIIRTIFNTISTTAEAPLRRFILGIAMLAASVVLYILNHSYNTVMTVSALMLSIVGGVLTIPVLTKAATKVMTRLMGLFFGGAARLGVMNVSGAKTTASSIVLASVMLSMIICVFNVATSISQVFQGALNSGWGEIVIMSGMNEPADYYEYISSTEGVESHDYIYMITGNGDDCADNIWFTLVGTDKPRMGIEDPYNVMPTLGEGEIAVDEAYAQKHGVEIGSYMTVTNDAYEAGSKSYLVKGFIDGSTFSTMRNLAVVTEREYASALDDIPATISISCEEGADVDRVLKNVVDATASDKLKPVKVSEWLGSQKAQVDDVMILIYVVMVLSGVLAIVGLINNQVVGFLQRQKEYAVLYSVAMSKRQLRTMIASEVSGSFLLGCLFGTVYGLWSSTITSELMYSMGFCIESSPDYPMLALIVGIAFAALSLTSLVPISKIGKIDVVKQIKYE